MVPALIWPCQPWPGVSVRGTAGPPSHTAGTTSVTNRPAGAGAGASNSCLSARTPHAYTSPALKKMDSPTLAISCALCKLPLILFWVTAPSLWAMGGVVLVGRASRTACITYSGWWPGCLANRGPRPPCMCLSGRLAHSCRPAGAATAARHRCCQNPAGKIRPRGPRFTAHPPRLHVLRSWACRGFFLPRMMDGGGRHGPAGPRLRRWSQQLPPGPPAAPARHACAPPTPACLPARPQAATAAPVSLGALLFLSFVHRALAPAGANPQSKKNKHGEISTPPIATPCVFMRAYTDAQQLNNIRTDLSCLQ